jgi:amino acid transporter
MSITNTPTRSMGYAGAVGLGVGAMIGGGILALAGVAFSVSGPSAILAFVLNGVIALITAMSFAEMASTNPQNGGIYTLSKRALTIQTAFGVGWVVWLASILAAVFYALGFGVFLMFALQNLPFTQAESLFSGKFPMLLTAIAATLYYSRKLSLSSRNDSRVTNLAKLAIFALLIVAGLAALPGKSLGDLTGSFRPFFTGGASGLAAAMGYSFVAMQGFVLVAYAAGEIKNPERNVPRALFTTIGIGMAVYIPLLFVVLTAGVPEGSSLKVLSEQYPETLIAIAAQNFLGTFGFWFVLAGGIFSMLSALQANLFAASRVANSMAADRTMLPEMSQLDSKYGTPTRAIQATGALAIILIVVLPDVASAAAASSLIFLLSFALAQLIMILMRVRSGEPFFKSDRGTLLSIGSFSSPVTGQATSTGSATHLRPVKAGRSKKRGNSATAEKNQSTNLQSAGSTSAMLDNDVMEENHRFRVPFYPSLPVIGMLATLSLALFQSVVVPAAGIITLVWLLTGSLLFIFFFLKHAMVADVSAQALDPEIVRLRGNSPLVLLPITNPVNVASKIFLANALAPPVVGRVLLLSIVKPGGKDKSSLPQLENMREVVFQALQSSFNAHLRPDTLITMSNDPWKEIERVARVHQCQSLLLGPGDFGDPKTAQKVEKLISQVKCDVVVLRQPFQGWDITSARKVLIPVAGYDKHDLLRARITASIWRNSRPEITFLQIVPANTSRQEHRKYRNILERFASEIIPERTRCQVLISDDVLASLVKCTAEHDLVIMGLGRIKPEDSAFGPIPLAMIDQTDTALVLICHN